MSCGNFMRDAISARWFFMEGRSPRRPRPGRSRALQRSALLALVVSSLGAAPVVTRLTPPSGLFSYGDAAPPYIARFLPGQRFDLQATVRPDAGKTILRAEFLVDGAVVTRAVALAPATVDGASAGTAVATLRAHSVNPAGVHTLTVRATQSDGVVVTASGSFEVVGLTSESGARPRNIIIMIGDGMGIAHRTAARVMLRGVSQGKALAPLAMDTLPATALVSTASLNSIVTDSAPGASCYATGNKADNNQEGVFPDDTKDRFDNPRIESIGEYFARTQGKWLGIVTTADVTDATPGAFGVHTQDRAAGTGIADQLIDESAAKSNLRVLLGGGRRWFLPDTTAGSGRFAGEDYELPDELANGWGVARGAIDAGRNLLENARTGGFTFAANASQLKAVPDGTRRLLGLFQLGNMNAALDRIQKRRGQSTVVDDYGFPEQPMLDEMTDAALGVLRQNAAGFVLMIEGGLIDKQSHQMDTERWLYEVIEFDRAVARAKVFVQSVPDTLLIVTADHETGGANIIGASVVSQADLAARAASGGGAATLRDEVVGTGVAASFPNYTILADGFPATPDVNRRMLIGYAANADRYEDWQTNAKPVDGPAGYPRSPMERDTAGRFLVVGQIPGTTAVHTGSDVPLSAQGAGASLFAGVMDNTDVFFKMMQAALGGTPGATASANPVIPASLAPSGVSALTITSVSQRTAKERLVNLSSRGLVGAGESAMINGFALAGSQPHQLLIRGVGPALAGYGVNGALADPFLRVTNAAGATVAMNDDWETNGNAATVREASERVGAFPLTTGGKDAALLLTLPPGNYTVELSGMGAATGVGLLEIYELP